MQTPARRHALSTRLWHWVNAASFVILFMSGLNISNAHPRLYWGEWGFAEERAWLILPRFPGWATIPDHYNLAAARDWHILFALVFAFGLLAFMAASLVNRHFARDLRITRREWGLAALRADIAAHLRLRFDAGAAKYNTLQKWAYITVIFVLLPLMIASGMAISPGAGALLPGLTDAFGGRQSARSIHFLAAFALFGFLVLHLAMVLLAHPLRSVRAMIVGSRDDAAA